MYYFQYLSNEPYHADTTVYAFHKWAINWEKGQYTKIKVLYSGNKGGQFKIQEDLVEYRCGVTSVKSTQTFCSSLKQNIAVFFPGENRTPNTQGRVCLLL